jgi:hypothetical protein
VWRKIRIVALLLVLGVVAWEYWYDRLSTTDWDETLTVGIFPIDDSQNAASSAYVAGLTDADVADIESFLNEEAARYGIDIERPVAVKLYKPVTERPPERPRDSGPLDNMWFSLKMRTYASRNSRLSGRPPQIRIFVRFHDPAETQSVPHSLGMQKGLVGLVHAFASRDQRARNNVVIAHEILHTLGATDKYDTATLAPLLPLGLADPDRSPLYPQDFAELMAGQVALSASTFEMPASLAEVLVGEATAREIRWVRE